MLIQLVMFAISRDAQLPFMCFQNAVNVVSNIMMVLNPLLPVPEISRAGFSSLRYEARDISGCTTKMTTDFLTVKFYLTSRTSL